MRQLATIQEVKEVDAIENADSIERLGILGWSVVSQKGNFSVGDKCVFFEPDSVLPEDAEWSQFLKDKKFKIKTIRLRGQISQGLALPLSEVGLVESDYDIGDDVTETLGVTKYEPFCMIEHMPIHTYTSFPHFIPKTDSTRIQSAPWLLETYKNKKFYVTEKLDGTSITIYSHNGEQGVCSRNIDIKKNPDNVYWRAVIDSYLLVKLEETKRNLAIQGELVGQDIQGNKYGFSGQNVLVYDVYDIDNQRYFDAYELATIADSLNLLMVPTIGVYHGEDLTIPFLTELATKSSNYTASPMEGIVVTSMENIVDKKFGRLRYKVINPEFLLHYDL